MPLAASLRTLASAESLMGKRLAGAAPGAEDGATPRLIQLPERLAPVDEASLPWQQRVRRVGQTNMTEHDPAAMNVEAWADYWHGVGADMVYVSVTGILAFYPSKVPFHKHGKYLNGRDFFGECARAAKQRGMRVVARMSPDLNWPEALAAHPEWAMRNEDGSVQHNTEQPLLFRTCMFTTYMTDYIPAIMREINSLYEVDCFYANGWPPLGSLPDCWCAVCRTLPRPNTAGYRKAFNDRLFAIWKLYDGIAREKTATSFFFPNMGGNVHAGPNLVAVGKQAAWFQADNQGRTYEDAAVWGCSMQGRVCAAVLDGKPAGNVTAAYSTGSVRWRNGSKTPAETRMWLYETLASGMIPYDHFIGGHEAFDVDKRWQPVCAEMFQWMARHDGHFRTRRTVANVGVVMGQATQVLYKGPELPSEDARSRAFMRETTHGVYNLMLDGRRAWDFVHEDRLEPERLKKYTALVLPNVALLTEAQCQQIAEYVRGGGSLVASFETSLYDEEGQRREEYGLGDVLGIKKAGAAVGTNGNAYYGRIEREHEILSGFTDTAWIAGAQNRAPVAAVADPVLTVVPGFVQYPPELAYPYVERTQEPAVVLRETGASRVAYFPGDIERTYWITGHGDLQRLYENTLCWVMRDQRAVWVDGDGLVEMFAWETEPGYAVHLLNYTNPNAQHGWLRDVHAIGPQRVALRLPAGVTVRRVEVLRAGGAVEFRVEDGLLRFTVPGVEDYEVAAVTV